MPKGTPGVPKLPKARHYYQQRDASAVDVHVGKRLRQARMLNDLSQEAVAEAIAISFQQLQKYEKGSNRISASALFNLAEVLRVDVAYFFEGLDEAARATLLDQARLP